MGFYWNAFKQRWIEIDHDRKLSRAALRRIERRAGLIEDRTTEMGSGARRDYAALCRIAGPYLGRERRIAL